MLAVSIGNGGSSSIDDHICKINWNEIRAAKIRAIHIPYSTLFDLYIYILIFACLFVSFVLLILLFQNVMWAKCYFQSLTLKQRTQKRLSKKRNQHTLVARMFCQHQTVITSPHSTCTPKWFIEWSRRRRTSQNQLKYKLKSENPKVATASINFVWYFKTNTHSHTSMHARTHARTFIKSKSMNIEHGIKCSVYTLHKKIYEKQQQQQQHYQLRMVIVVAFLVLICSSLTIV